MLLVRLAAQFFFFFRVADEGGLDQHAGDVGGFEHGKTGLLDTGFVQLAHAADLAQQAVAQRQAVLDLRCGAHVEQGVLHLSILPAQVHAADVVGLVFFLRHPARRSARGPALAEREHAGALRTRGVEGIGVDADKQVRLHAPGFLHAHMQGHKKVSISRQERPHGAAAHAAGVDALAQHFGDFEDHVFFARAAWANGTRVLAAMARVQRDHDQPVGAWWLGCLARAARVVHEGAFAAGQVGSAGRWRGQRQGTCAGLGLPGDQIAQGVIHCGRGSGQAVHGRRGFGRGALLDQLLQRVNGLAGVEVEHQAVCVRGHGLQAKDLRCNGVLEVDHQAHHVGAELAHADAGNVRVRRLNLPHQLAQCGVQLHALDVYRQARW